MGFNAYELDRLKQALAADGVFIEEDAKWRHIERKLVDRSICQEDCRLVDCVRKAQFVVDIRVHWRDFRYHKFRLRAQYLHTVNEKGRLLNRVQRPSPRIFGKV